MARKLTVAERESFGYRAWQLSSRGMSAPAIARTLKRQDPATGQARSLDEKTVDGLLKEQRARAAAAIELDRPLFEAEFIAEQRAVLGDCWDRLTGSPDGTGEGVPGIQANALRASVNIAKVRGLFVDRVEHSGGVEVLKRVYIGVDWEQI